jgi:BolA family transcriptional regulator, general stress-responsive regulator
VILKLSCSTRMSLDAVLIKKLRETLGDGTEARVDIEGANCGGKAQVMVTSPSFEGLSRLERHRRVHDCLAQEIKDNLHAISITAKTPKEVEK